MPSDDRNPTAGIGDPYWYEWTIGQDYVVEMLNPDNGIETVTLQSTEAQGLDDVVVVYTDGSSEYVQVKHTRSEDTVTFGNMLSLLKSMSKAWASQKRKWRKCRPVLFSNRKVGTTEVTMKVENGSEYKRPALDQFLPHFQSEVAKAVTLSDIRMKDEWKDAWSEWCNALNVLAGDEEKLEFLKLLVIKVDQPGLDELKNQVTQKIAKTFGISEGQAISVFSKLDHALREWGTTFRGEKEAIDREDVYDVLSLKLDDLVGDHMLMPHEPFFPSRMQFLEDMENQLLTGTEPVTFLTGSPGQGKTTIVSALASRRDPVIDLRYHAFKPITPQTKMLSADAGITTRSEVLWGDLLTELRNFFFKGRLARFNVPISNDFLTVNQLRDEVLRLANIVGEERGRRAVIAIDGIDHAARAGVDQHSFLETLVPPDAVPGHVCFLIVGQPANAYDKYPSWLRDGSAGVSHWVVEGIQQEDISELLAAETQSLPTDQFEATVRVIHEVAQGNTLAAIFAVEEAKGVASVEELQAKLENRRLTDGVSAYYEQIWSAAVKLLEERFVFVGQRLAGCLSLIKERTTGEDLANIFAGVLNISSADWTEVLRALSPLVIEEADGFRVTHNDVRVHLTKRVHAQPERLREVASLIADYYWSDLNKGNARHASLFELLRLSNRKVEQARVLTPEYVMEGIALQRPIRELHEQCQLALLHVADTGDWDCVHTVTCAVITLEQFHKSVDWMGRSYDYVPDVPPLLFSEGRVPNKESWTLQMIKDTMADAYRLIQADQLHRARCLMGRWFADITPIELGALLGDEVFDNYGDEPHLNDSFRNMLTVWGQVSYHVGLLWAEEKEPDHISDPREGATWAQFSDGLNREAIDFGGLREWIWSRQASVRTFVSSMEENIMRLAFQRRWVEVAYALKEWAKNRDVSPDTFKIKAAALSLFTGRKDLFAAWVQPLVDEGFASVEQVEMFGNMNEHSLLYCMVAFVLGWTQPHRDNSGIAEEGVRSYFSQKGDERRRGHMSALLRGSALAGKWLGAFKRSGATSAESIVMSREVAQVLDALVRRERNIHETVFNHEVSTKLIIEILVECSMLIGGPLDRTVYEFVKGYCQTYPYNYMLEIGWRYLWDRGDEELLEKWFLHWCGSDGKAWRQNIATRVDIVNRLSDLADKFGFQKEEAQARLMMKWGMIGYSGNKEYVLKSPKDWYKDLANVDPRIWETQGKRLVEISQTASTVGDIRTEIYVDAEVAGSVVRAGVPALWRLLNAENMTSPLLENTNMMFDGIISGLEKVDVSEQDLLSIWSFGVGVLNWQAGVERCYLQDLKKAILLSADRVGITSLERKLEGLGPAEFHVDGERDRYRIPERWYEDFENRMSSNDRRAMEFYQSLKVLPIEQAINRLIEPDESEDFSGNLWLGIHLVSKRLEEEKPIGYPAHLQRLVDLVLTRNHTPYRWSGYRVHLAYQTLLPLVRDSVRLDLLKKAIANLEFNSDPRIWLDSAAENLDNFCRYRAVATGIEDLTNGLERHLKLHEMWIRGNGILPDMRRIDLPEVQQFDSVPATWSEFAVRYLFRILQSNSLTRIQLALRGLWSLGQVAPTELGCIAQHWERLSLSAKERVLVVVERAASSAPSVYAPFSEIVKECYDGVDLSLKLQAWVILQAVQRRTGEECPEWHIPRHPEYETLRMIRPSERGVLDVPSIPRGLSFELHGSDLVHSLLRRLEAVTLDDVEDIERKFVAYSIVNPLGMEDKKSRVIPGQMGERNLPHRDYLMKLIYHEMYTGRWKDVPLVALAQALLRSDEPFVLLQSPPPAVDANQWSIDYELEQLPKDKQQIFERVLPHIQAGLSDDEVVIGAVLHSYASSMEVEVSVDTVLKATWLEMVSVERLATLNGRTFALYDDDRFDPQAANVPILNMTCSAGGIGEFNNQSMLCYPSLIWSEVLRWYPSDTDPLVWIEDGQPIIRFENVHGKVRDIVRGQLHRQPFLQRWVCSKKVLDKVAAGLEVSISQSVVVRVTSVEE